MDGLASIPHTTSHTSTGEFVMEFMPNHPGKSIVKSEVSAENL